MMDRRIKAPPILDGELIPPGDKSISHRAIILNSVAAGKAKISNLAPGADCLSTVTCLRALGVTIQESRQEEPPVFTILGAGRSGLREAEDVLDAGNSATAMRLLSGVLAAQPFLSIINGDASLRSRPMDRVIRPLRLMGAQIWGRGGDAMAPLAIKGDHLHGIEYQLPIASAQVKSAILIAALFAEGDTTVEEPAPSRDHTERLLQAMGAKVRVHDSKITVSPASLTVTDVCVPGDISSAAFWLVAGAVHPRAHIRLLSVGVNPTRTGVLDALRAMGARIEVMNQRMEGGEPVADLLVESSDLTGTQIGGKLIPRLIDEIPAICVAASVAKGTTIIRDATELRAKESDRIRTTVMELSKLGADIEELPDGIAISGVKELHGAECASHGDHRLAMALGVAALIARGETVIHNTEAADISYPGFWENMKRLGAG